MTSGISNLANSYMDYGSYDLSPYSKNNEKDLKTDPSSGIEQCATCENRRYVDGSNENVSLKAPTKLSPEAAALKVRSHEGEHVANAYEKAEQNNGKVISASVSIKTAICPECGNTYVAGGVTSTSIKFPGEKEQESDPEQMDPYSRTRKILIGDAIKGLNVDVKIGSNK